MLSAQYARLNESWASCMLNTSMWKTENLHRHVVSPDTSEQREAN